MKRKSAVQKEESKEKKAKNGAKLERTLSFHRRMKTAGAKLPPPMMPTKSLPDLRPLCCPLCEQPVNGTLIRHLVHCNLSAKTDDDRIKAFCTAIGATKAWKASEDVDTNLFDGVTPSMHRALHMYTQESDVYRQLNASM